MWRLIYAPFRAALASDSTFFYENPSYLQYVVTTLKASVAPCVLQDVVKAAIVDLGYFTATPIMWIIFVLAFAYSRHRLRMVLAEKSRYYELSFVRDWFEEQQREEKERGVHEIDGTVRDRDFRYDDVKITKEDFKILCRNLCVEPQHRFDCWSDVIYVSRAVHIVIAALSLIVCLIGSFALAARTVNSEIEAGAPRVALYDIVDNMVYIVTDYSVVPEYRNPKLCSAKFDVTVHQLDDRRNEFANALANDFLCGANDAVTRFTSMLLVAAGFVCMFQLWLVAFVKSTIRRPSSIIANRRPVCILVANRHTQLLSFLLPISIGFCYLLEITIHRFRNERTW